ncbi:MAG: hypothetical protein KUL76_04095 [Kaistella sp.]|nr:hypothetical protein [Kaistella sp.]
MENLNTNPIQYLSTKLGEGYLLPAFQELIKISEKKIDGIGEDTAEPTSLEASLFSCFVFNFLPFRLGEHTR